MLSRLLHTLAAKTAHAPPVDSSVAEHHERQYREHTLCSKMELQGVASIHVIVESSSIVFIGSPQVSSGAFLTGQLFVDLLVPHTTVIKQLGMRLLAINTTKKRVVSRRCGCNYHIAEIYTWRFFTRSAVPPDGLHSFPFSCLLPGHLPATIDSSFATLDYYLSVDLTTSAGRCTYTRTIKIKRAVLSIDEVHWVRTFPPTSITASVKHPSVVHPTGDFVIGLRLSGMVQEKLDFRERWGLHRISWYIEETQKFIALPCSKHMQEPGDGCRRVLRDEVRVIASEDVKTGWRTDFETGVIDVEFNAACNISLKPLCNVESQCGINVKHNLVIRMVVAKERAPLVKLSETVVTGAALVLCAQSPLVFAECPETVVAWDKEEPPTYESASASPPSYLDACN